MTLRAFRYKLPLVAHIQLKGNWVAHREGILLNRSGYWAEASPLPGFSRETLDDVIQDLRSGSETSPSLRFALGSLDQCDAVGARPAELSIAMNALVQGSEDEICEQCQHLVDSSCSTVKLKVRDARRDVQFVHRLRDELGPKPRIRLDANRAWNYDQAKFFLAAVQCSGIDYIEEPLTTPNRLEELYEETNVDYALDETLRETDLQIDSYPNAAALVIKPTILGGPEQLERLAASGKPLVFSAAYESGVGIAQIAWLAAKYSSDEPAGLDTYSRLADDVLTSRLQISDWTLKVPTSLQVRTEMLEPIDLG